MLEFLGGSVVYSILKDIWSAIRGRRPRLTPERVLELRQKWKKEIEPILWKRARDKLSFDVIIRDVKRLDHYPDNTDANRHGISAWFKAGLSSTYHNGIEVNRSWYGLGSRLKQVHHRTIVAMATAAAKLAASLS
jgi:hypothetical protein